MSIQPIPSLQFAICVQNAEYPAALEVRKIYQLVPDNDAAQHQLVRVIDESGEDYLYPANHFLVIEFPQAIQEVLRKAA